MIAINAKTRYALIAAAAALATILLVVLHYRQLFYFHDALKSRIINGMPDILIESADATIPGRTKAVPWNKPYKHLPPGFTRAGALLLYRAPEKTTLHAVAVQAIRYTDFFDLAECSAAIGKANALHEPVVPRDAALVIPDTLPGLVRDYRNRTMPPVRFTRGLYFTGSSAGRRQFIEKLDTYVAHGINTIVFDVKDIGGEISYRSSLPEVRRLNSDDKYPIHNIRRLIAILKEKKIYTIARIALFHDHLLSRKEPTWAIRSRRTGERWNPEYKERWVDPTNRKVQDYNIGLAVELAEMGVDEIQFDYIRFPTKGNHTDMLLSNDFGRKSREATITEFLKRAHDAISARNSRLSIDIFGVVAWGKEVDISKTGQRIELLSRYCDVISPMLYPSHFEDDFDGYAKPGDNPYYFIYNGCEKVKALSKGKALIRPWLQAFRWRVSSYDARYIVKQVKASDDAKAYGYLFWNASNSYDTVLEAFTPPRPKGEGAKGEKVEKKPTPRIKKESPRSAADSSATQGDRARKRSHRDRTSSSSKDNR